MSQDEDQVENPDFKEVEQDLDKMTIAQLRNYAALMKVPFAKDSTKNDILNAIKYRGRHQTLVKITNESDAPPPGYWKIRLMKDGANKARNLPVYVQVNGRTATIPRGIPCNVPYKIVEVLRNSTHPQVVEDSSLAFNDPKRIRIETSPSYPFEVLDKTDGPDPWPGNEIGKQASYGPREKFWRLFGRWPKRGEVHDAIKQGFIKMEVTERLPQSEVQEKVEKRPNK